MSHKYVKDESFDPIYNQVNPKFLAKARIYPAISLAIGLVILISQVIVPLVVFETQSNIPKPITSSILGLATGFGDFKYKELENNSQSVNNVSDEKIPKYFYLTIPKLKIDNALVETNSKSLSPDTALGHYPGSALPGSVGDTFIFGHSVLPWFYNPKNYKTIFSTIESLEAGDKFYINYDDKILTYKVESKEVVSPANVNPLAEFKPKFLNYSTVTLMTCYPSGTKAKRILVRAMMVTE